MGQPKLLVACLLVVMATGVGQAREGEQGTDLRRMATQLDLSERGVRLWLHQLGVNGDRDGEAAERLLAVSMTGERLLERPGGSSSVRVDPELDRLLLLSDRTVVLIHNHPANVGLSGADLRQLTKPGVVAIVAIGHDGSVYMASGGPRLDWEFFEERQYAPAKAEVLQRLRTILPSGRVSVAASDAHGSHLVTRALERAGIIRYWFELRGARRESYESARSVFGQVVEGAAGRLRKK
jgi:hypothetical protein